MEKEYTSLKTPAILHDLHIPHQIEMDCDTCILLEFLWVTIQLEGPISSQLRRKPLLIQLIPTIAWWIKFLTQQSLWCFVTIDPTLNTL